MTHLIAPGKAHALRIDAGRTLDITDVEGRQVADMVAFTADPDVEWLSPTHTRSSLGRFRLRQGDTLLTNVRRPILQLSHDDVGVHDMAFAMCDAERYRDDFGLADHANCRDAMAEALVPYGIPVHRIPDPVNVFQNSEISPDGSIETLEPRSRAGDRASFTALVDVLVVVTACPQDQNPCNGWSPSPIQIGITEGEVA